MSLVLRPWTIKAAKPWIKAVHRRLPDVTGALWAVRVLSGDQTVGCAVVGMLARVWNGRVLCVTRVAVAEGHRNSCSMLYGACSGAARAMGAEDLVTYTHLDEAAVSVKAAGWVDGGLTKPGEWDRPERQRELAIDSNQKRRWFAPWGMRAQMPGVRHVREAARSEALRLHFTSETADKAKE